MNNKFDALARGLAQSVTRRGALKKLGLGLAGIALASLGLADLAHASPACKSDSDCAGQTCCHGKCVNLLTDNRNCGACGNRCRTNQFQYCLNGHCFGGI
jgi:hypothetical protein